MLRALDEEAFVEIGAITDPYGGVTHGDGEEGGIGEGGSCEDAIGKMDGGEKGWL